MKSTKFVPQKSIKGSIDGKIRNLKKADIKPYIYLPHKGRPQLSVIRYGMSEGLPISRRVAEELIAAGFSYGN